MASRHWQQQADRIDALLQGRHSPLAGLGLFFVTLGQYHGVDGRLVVAIAGAETSFATDPGSGSDITVKHNAWGYGPGRAFPSWRVGIEHVCWDLGTIYLPRGFDTVAKIAPRWVGGPAPDWTSTVESVLRQLGGNPGILHDSLTS